MQHSDSRLDSRARRPAGAVASATPRRATRPRRGAPRDTAVHRVYAGLRRRIVDITLPPGALIAKHEVAEEFGVSLTPVREAILRLADEGLIDVFPQSRTMVSLIDVQHAREAHFLRLSVEVEIARRLCETLSPGQVADLRGLVGKQAAALDDDDLDTFVQGDDNFHAHLYELAGVGGLWDLILTRRAHIDRLRRLHLPAPGKAAEILEQHRKLVDVFESGNADAAEREVRGHLGGTLAAAEEIRGLHPEYFTSATIDPAARDSRPA